MSNNYDLVWQKLQQHAQSISKITLNDMFAADPKRAQQFTLHELDLLIDFSKQQINADTVKLLCSLAQEHNLAQRIEDLCSGKHVNVTENRPALHMELRNPKTQNPAIKQVLHQMNEFVNSIQDSEYTDVIVLGIGGSDLGPRLVCEALSAYKVTDINLHFIANVDGNTITPMLKQLNPASTICIVNSKTFTTIETLANATLIKEWFGTAFITNTYAVTANPKAAIEFGIAKTKIFEFWDWVGGRYSVWSAVGLPIALSVGMANFQKFLIGAHEMDQHFITADFVNNMPVMLALLGIWNINFKNYPTLAIIPYSDGLQLLPAYLQQLDMESNGKSAMDSGGFVNYQTSPVIWGGVGCNAQHAFMQMLHQGTQVVPVDFLVARNSICGPDNLQQLLIASCLGQSQALMMGRNSPDYFKRCSGNRPSTTIMFDKITPEFMGKLIALYEHKTFVQGVIWQIQSFDQWGVQLGKDLIKDILSLLQGADLQEIDSSTADLVNYAKGF